MSAPQRIVCLTEETTETLYLLGEDRRIVGISGFTVRPPEARREKPKVSAFTSAKIDKILALRGCLKSSGCRKPMQHQTRHREVNHRLTTLGQPFIIFTQTA